MNTIQIKNGPESRRQNITPIVGELIWTTDTKKLYMGDGSTQGGIDFISLAQGQYVPLSQKGQVDGVASLDSNGYIPLDQLNVVRDYQAGTNITYSSSRINTLLDGKVDSVNTKTRTVVLDGSDIEITGYVIPGASGSLTPTDTINTALGKLEKGLNDAIAGGGDPNVQSDWNQTDTGSDDYIKNKPTSVTQFDVIDLGSARIITATERNKLNSIAYAAEVNVQSDWTQTSTLSDSYIQNKPHVASSFGDLLDAQPYDINDAKRIVAVNATGDGLIYTSIDDQGGIAVSWTSLSDTPGGFIGAAGKMTRVNSTETSLEFIDNTLATHDDMGIINPLDGQVLIYNGAQSRWENRSSIDGGAF